MLGECCHPFGCVSVVVVWGPESEPRSPAAEAEELRARLCWLLVWVGCPWYRWYIGASKQIATAWTQGNCTVLMSSGSPHNEATRSQSPGQRPRHNAFLKP